MTVGQKIKELRNNKGLTQKALADNLHVTFQTVSKWESDINEPDIETLKKIAKLFDVSVDDLVNSEEVDNNEITELSQTKASLVNKKRATFYSGVILHPNAHPYYYSYSLKGKEYKYDASFAKQQYDLHNQEISQRKYSQVIRIQKDDCVDFFVDDERKVFGLYYDHAEQFICPFENLVFLSIKETVSKIESENVRCFNLNIKFYGGGNTLDELSFRFLSHSSCSKKYWADNNLRNLEQTASMEAFSRSSINKINNLIPHFKEVGEQIKEGLIKVEPYDINEKTKESLKGQEPLQEAQNNYYKHIARKMNRESYQDKVLASEARQKAARHSASVDDGSFAAGFFLSFFLGLIGLIISLASIRKSRTNHGAVVGFVVQFVAGIAFGLFYVFSHLK